MQLTCLCSFEPIVRVKNSRVSASYSQISKVQESQFAQYGILRGEEEFCEVFFDNVKVPAENIVGEINSGWALAKALLGFERIFFGSPKQAQYALQRLSTMAKIAGADQDPVFKEKIAQLKLDVADLGSLYGTFVQNLRQGLPLGPDVSILKIWATETTLRIANALIEVSGAAGGIRPRISDTHAIDALSAFYSARAATIYGGTSEIQRNIVAAQRFIYAGLVAQRDVN